MLAKPILRWAGGKAKLVPHIRERMPARYGAYHEPFFGGGALFFHLTPKKAFINDANATLMDVYRQVRDDVDGVIKVLRRLPRDEETFYKIRERNFEEGTKARRAAEFLYCNKCCFNGLFRVNKDGKFNVPFDRYKTDANVVCDKPTLVAASEALKGARITSTTFQIVLSQAKKDDFVYFDPPYAPLSPTSNFTAFSKNGFGDSDQKDLRDVALELKKRGVHVLISNSTAPIVYELYKRREFTIDHIMAARAINSDADLRGKIKEVLIR